ncbi:hypothetical protein TNCV_1922761 [Trichonephila clavipes]|nr:hypothetical protein TNCV_1922761 [Trichonephila clavipes]
MVRYVRKKGSLPYIGSRTSEGIPWAKAIRCERSTCVSKARFQGWGHAKVGSRLDAFPNRPTTSRLPVACNACDLKGRLPYFEGPPKIGETTHAKELYVDSCIPRQIQMTRKLNDGFSKRTCTPKLGSKKRV